jgi:stearoyl-CoA desaturase (delta-9 desaturase)
VNTKQRSLWDYTTASGLFIVVYHVALLIGVPIYLYYNTPGTGLLVASALLLFLTEIGIGGAYHRFYSHRAYSLSKPAEGVLLFLATVAFQGSALRWSFEHRLHHTFVDSDRDPYSIKKGFWYAHVLWLFDKAQPIDEGRVTDLVRNPLVRFQHRFYGILSVGSNVLLWLLVGWMFNDYLGAFVLAWWTRLLISHHLTWFVNSLAHCWGERTYSKEQSAVDNAILAFLTVGEGYHNYHHTFASDYRNGVRWYHFDPVKWTIWSLNKLGLAGDLRRINAYTIKRRLLVEDKKLFLQTLSDGAHERRKELEERVHQLHETMQEKIARIRELARDIKKMRRDAQRQALATARSELKALKGSLRRDWESWWHLGGQILDAAPA